jgi:hypothetical protein
LKAYDERRKARDAQRLAEEAEQAAPEAESAESEAPSAEQTQPTEPEPEAQPAEPEPEAQPTEPEPEAESAEPTESAAPKQATQMLTELERIKEIAKQGPSGKYRRLSASAGDYSSRNFPDLDSPAKLYQAIRDNIKNVSDEGDYTHATDQISTFLASGALQSEQGYMLRRLLREMNPLDQSPEELRREEAEDERINRDTSDALAAFHDLEAESAEPEPEAQTAQQGADNFETTGTRTPIARAVEQATPAHPTGYSSDTRGALTIGGFNAERYGYSTKEEAVADARAKGHKAGDVVSVSNRFWTGYAISRADPTTRERVFFDKTSAEPRAIKVPLADKATHQRRGHLFNEGGDTRTTRRAPGQGFKV